MARWAECDRCKKKMDDGKWSTIELHKGTNFFPWTCVDICYECQTKILNHCRYGKPLIMEADNE